MRMAPVAIARAAACALLLSCGVASATAGEATARAPQTPARETAPAPAQPAARDTAPAPRQPQTPAPPPQQTPPSETAPAREAAEQGDEENALPVSLDRIRRRATDDRAPVFTLPEREVPTFAVEIERRLPRFEDFVQPGELNPGPVGATSPYHAEMMSMITPPEARPFGAFTGGNLLLIALQSLLTGYMGQQVPGWVEQMMREQREAEARREVQAVVEELERRQAEQRARERAAAAAKGRADEIAPAPDPPTPDEAPPRP
jgi:hypothetical protein